jgi:hypothetical protein
MVQTSKKLVAEKGILSSPNVKTRLPPAKDEMVKQLHVSDEISRAMPGTKDYVSVDSEGKTVRLQKRLILCNLKEVYLSFKEQNPEKLLGFSKLAELRPKNCVLAGASGMHAVCVRTIHQNVKLMISGANLYDLAEKQVKTYDDCLSCNVPSVSFYQGDCTVHPGTENLIKKTFNRDFKTTKQTI